MNPMEVETKICQSCKSRFSVDEEDAVMYRGFDIPLPEECHRCRIRNLFTFWIFGAFRKTTSALSGKSVITNLPEDVPYPIYARDEWMSDAWDPMEHGREYDFSRGFFEQFKELQKAVPHPHQAGIDNVACEWSDDIWNSKNCYLCRSLLGSEDLSYVFRVVNSKNSVDITYCFDMDRSYDCLYCFKCYETKYAFDSRNCITSAFLFDCRDLQNCFMCWNLRSKQYCIRNVQYTKEEYFEKLKELDLRSYASVQKLKAEFAAIVEKEAVHRENFNTQVSDCEGNFLTQCRNCRDCMLGEEGDNCRHVWRFLGGKDSIDCVGGGYVEKSALVAVGGWLYEAVATVQSMRCRFSAYLEYCEECEYCFGCVGIRKKKYCIFNKQYTEAEYKELVGKIILAMKERGEWGRFFPLSFAGFGYNLSNAALLFPENKESILGMGGLWHDFKDEAVSGMSADDLPDRIDDVPDDIVKQALTCPETKRRYNIAPHELAFYRQHGIPLPRRHFDLRTIERFRPIALAISPRDGACCFCSKPIVHYFPEELGYEKIACVECYQKEIV